MVTNFNGNIGQDSKYVYENKYMQDKIKTAGTAATISSENDSDSFSNSAKFTLASAAVFEGVPLALYAKRNSKLNGAMTASMNSLSDSTQKALENLRKGEGSFFERLGKYFKVVNHNNLEYGKIKTKAKAKANMPEYIKTAQQRSKNAAESSYFKGIKEWWAKRAKTTLEEKKKLAGEIIRPGIIENGAGESVSALKKANNFIKSTGALPLLLFSGLIEGVTEIYPTFSELGQEKGMKQLGKSCIHVAADTVGFIAGQQAGMAIGSAIGTALFPGVGTAIGGITGFICGCFASHGVDEVTKHFIGKSELELAKEEQNNNENLNQNKNVFSMSV